MTPIILRPDQARLKSDVYDAWNAGARVVLAQLSTGGGKSVIASDIILDGHNQGMNEVIMAHRNELVSQMSCHIARRGIPHRIIGSKKTVAAIINDHRGEFGRSFVNPDARCAVGSVQTIVSRADHLREWGQQIHRFTGDEGHHFLRGNTWGKAVDLFPNARGLLVTACTTRADGMGLGSHYDGIADALCVGPPMRELIDIGALSEYEIIIPTTDYNIGDDAITAKGDFSPVKMREASKRSHIVSDAVTEYRRWIPSKRAICFATDVETANSIAAQFNDCGISAASVSAKSDESYRREMIKRFRDGRLLVLVNVDLFDEGFDVPGCDAVIMARPTASLNKYLQMFGRALRVALGKSHGTIIDLVSNVLRHGLPDKPHIWSLDRREKRSKRAPDPDDIPLTACRECSRPYERIYNACPYCGHQPVPAGGGGRSIDMVDGDLMLLDRDKLAELRAAMTLETPADLSARVGFAAGELAARGAVNRLLERREAQERLTAAVEQWAGMRRAAGDTDSMIHRRFYHALGVDVLTAMAGKRSEMDALTNTVRSWYGGELFDTQKKSIEQLMIESAIERGDQGFRGGWVEVRKLTEMTGLYGLAVKNQMSVMGYHFISKYNKTLDGVVFKVSLYHTDPNADPEDFWISNGYSPELEPQIRLAIEQGKQGFRKGWVSTNELTDLTGINGSKVPEILNRMGFHSLGTCNKKIKGRLIQTTLYNLNPNADSEDFWVSNGYVPNHPMTIINAVKEGRVGFREGWIETGKVSELIGESSQSTGNILRKMGFNLIGRKNKRYNGVAVYVTLYHTDPNADPADFWSSNGYV